MINEVVCIPSILSNMCGVYILQDKLINLSGITSVEFNGLEKDKLYRFVFDDVALSEKTALIIKEESNGTVKFTPEAGVYLSGSISKFEKDISK